MATFSYNDLIKSSTGTFRFDLQNIVNLLFSDPNIKAQFQRIDSEFSPEKLAEYLRTDTIQISLATGIQADGAISFYPPFESQILQLIDKTNLDSSELSDFIKRSTIFKYGLYRQIKTAKNVDIVENVWGIGDVPFEQLS